MNESKDITDSKTVQSAAVAGILGAIALMNALGAGIDFDQGQITEIVTSFVIIISAGVAIWGRITAKHILK